jgi:hypothetical protein
MITNWLTYMNAMQGRVWSLRVVALCGVACGTGPTPPGAQVGCPPQCTRQPPPEQHRNPIPEENQSTGDPQWRSGRRCWASELDLYLSTDSASAGDRISVMIAAVPATSATAQIFRLGYYGGAGARRIWSGGPYNIQGQPACPRDPSTGRIECRWSETFSFSVGTDWVSGVYVVKVMRPDGFKRFAPFVVRDGRPAELLYKLPMNTYQAYNGWGGESLYRDDSGTIPSGHANEVSYDRPFADGDGASLLPYQEYPFIRVLEQYGYDVTYATNLDFARFPHLLDGIGALVTAGHDEYWAVEERALVDAAVNSGPVSLAYFSANGSYWRVRYLNNSQGTPLRTVVGYKGDPRDPIPGSTNNFRDPPNANPENRLFGIMYDAWQVLSFPLVVADPNHWLFAATQVSAGEQFPGLVGNEFDRYFAGAPADVNLITESPVVAEAGYASSSNVAERTLPSGNIVFAAGTIFWSNGLNQDIPDNFDSRVVRMTLNVLERALAHRRSVRALPAADSIQPQGPSTDPRWVASVDAYAGMAGGAGWADGPGGSARFSGPTGLAATASGQIIVADTGNQRIRLIDNDPLHTVRTIAGNGTAGYREGPGANAMFRNPTSVAIAPDGAILVADSENYVIRRIENNPPTWTVSTYAGTPERAGFINGPASMARFRLPVALAIDAQGNVYVADLEAERIRTVQAGTRQVSTYAGTGSSGWRDAPVGTDAQFASPTALAWAPNGDLYVLDASFQYLRRVSARDAHPVDTIAGRQDDAIGLFDGSGSRARFRAQLGMVVTSAGEILLADSANFRIRKVVPGSSAATTYVYTIAGSGSRGRHLGPGQVADIVAPTGLAIAPNQRVFVSDSYNQVIRSIVR